MFKRLVLALALGLAGVHAKGDSGTTQMCCRQCGQNSFTSCKNCIALQEDIGKGDCKGCKSGYFKAECPDIAPGGTLECYCTSRESNGPCNKC